MIKLLNKFAFKKLINNKKFLIAVSIIISIVIWFIAAIGRNPIREKTFSDVAASITLKDTVASEKYGLQIISDVSQYKFKVTVKGTTHVISGITKEDFSLKADVSDINEPNENCVLKLVAEKLDDSDYEFVSIEPATVTVKIDLVDTKEFDLTAAAPVETVTDTENGYIVETPELTNTTQNKINITGSATSLAKIKTVLAVADYDGSLITKSKTFDAYIRICDKDDQVIYTYTLDGKVLDGAGNPVENPELTPEFTSTKVTISILKKATLPVTPVFKNLPSDLNASDIVCTLTPANVTVVGHPDIIASLTSVNLKAIDYKEISSDYSSRIFKVGADLVANVRILDDNDNSTSFTVRVNRINGNKYYK